MELQIKELKTEIRWIGLFSSDIPSRKNLDIEGWQKIFTGIENKK